MSSEIADRPISNVDSAISGIDVPLHGDVQRAGCSAAFGSFGCQANDQD
jgi:hypothetical protein